MILITGSTGKVGQQVLSALQTANAPFTALARSDASARELTARGVRVVRGDLGDPATLRPAMRGITRLFLLSSGVDPHAGEAAAIGIAREAGVRRIVKLSALGSHADATNSFLRGHARAERLLEDSGLEWTSVRPTFFMQNWLIYNAPSIRAGQPVYSNTGESRLAWVDTRDIAGVVAAALTGDEHVGRILDLTGPEALSYSQVTERLGKRLGRTVQHIAVNDRAAYAAMAAGMPAAYAFALTTLNQAVRRGIAETTTDTVELVTGRPARTMDAFLTEHLGEFRG